MVTPLATTLSHPGSLRGLGPLSQMVIHLAYNDLLARLSIRYDSEFSRRVYRFLRVPQLLTTALARGSVVKGYALKVSTTLLPTPSSLSGFPLLNGQKILNEQKIQITD